MCCWLNAKLVVNELERCFCLDRKYLIDKQNKSSKLYEKVIRQWQLIQPVKTESVLRDHLQLVEVSILVLNFEHVCRKNSIYLP